MTVPEENRPKTRTTDDTSAARPDKETRDRDRERQEGGRSMREALEEAGVDRDDYEER
ncbi:hypothetical protein AB0A69_27055 [Streptomyces sp. NPDC045431]|uniref:hypothetical protein n=1 Tax=Streptomyces sp. NPDC045431 TaxID=3155613 RepID=UPI0033CE58FD